MYVCMYIMQVLLTPTHLAIVMEYAAGGELFETICNAGRFSEDEVIRINFLLSPYIYMYIQLSNTYMHTYILAFWRKKFVNILKSLSVGICDLEPVYS